MVLDQVSITRSELLAHKQQLELTRQGYDLLDKKRLALLQEISSLQEQVVRTGSGIAECQQPEPTVAGPG